MKVTVQGHQMDVGEFLMKHVEENLKHKVKKYFPDFIDAQVTFSKTPHDHFEADIAIHPTAGESFFSKQEALEAYEAFDLAVHRLEEQFRRAHEKNKDHHVPGHKEINPLLEETED